MSMNPTSPPPIDYERFDAREVAAAAPDWMAHAFGQALPGRTLHPIARSLDLATVAHAFGVLNGAQSGPAGTRGSAVVARGAATSGFLDLFRRYTAPVLLQAYQAATQRPYAATLELPDFRAQSIFSIDAAVGLERLNGEFSVISRRRAFNENTAYALASMQSYAKIFEISRDDLLGNDTKSLVNLLLGAGSLAAAVEAGLLASAVEDAPALSDGAVFDATNTVASALSAETLGQAVGMLRTQGATGRPLNIAPKHLVVEPGLEMLARKLICDADMGGQIQISTLPGLAAGRWLVLGDPELVPCLTLVTLEGDSLNYHVQRPFKSDGVDLRVLLTSGAMLAGRIGIVRGGA
ncbi:phage major capsid protein [Comamonas granuli]|uniref:phage major capsid protein n=1 Tax=Comamonas granuli TaxID=290309 RepID=UPI0005A993F4|nr:hypothetical protein [Comamonas granuli]